MKKFAITFVVFLCKKFVQFLVVAHGVLLPRFPILLRHFGVLKVSLGKQRAADQNNEEDENLQ